MDPKDRAAWRQVLEELRSLQKEYERMSRERDGRCAAKRAEPQPELIALTKPE
jgi:hypothetical protein